MSNIVKCMTLALVALAITSCSSFSGTRGIASDPCQKTYLKSEFENPDHTDYREAQQMCHKK
ncbi:hypothetical protein [Bacteriovorax sp. DB6_IX]|uniref:hypothetical protein n=1 Tax=Bacteriovorax sp. DB6_IX TaxID=1353530 RepID=UPI00038A14AC|nr:hypothetical protein [Bacteriovorax sp. DB6_IX]EQC52503.1 putative lipoprotein [Bacteriovorax sp. DB6_IX]